jgi:hypothetical protein
MAYYTNVGPNSGPLLARAGYYAIGVLPASQAKTLIGTAVVIGKDQDGRALWRLTVEDVDLPGRFVAIDRAFRPAD